MSEFENLKRTKDNLSFPFPFTPASNQVAQQNTMNVADGATTPNIPKGAYEVLVQALDQNIRYFVDGSIATNTTGYRLTAGNDPISIPIINGRTTLSFAAELDGAILVMTFGE